MISAFGVEHTEISKAQFTDKEKRTATGAAVGAGSGYLAHRGLNALPVLRGAKNGKVVGATMAASGAFTGGVFGNQWNNGKKSKLKGPKK